jgi:hypothetical protein
MQSDFSRLGLFREMFFRVSPTISGVQAGFSRFGILLEYIIDLGRNWEGKSSIPEKIQGIGARKFVAI